MDEAETFAKRAIEEAHPQGRMIYREDQSNGECDFLLQRDDQPDTAVEVTASVDETAEAMIASLRNPKKGGPTVAAKRVKGYWYVHPCSTARIDKIRAEVDEYLEPIEQHGATHFFAPTDAYRDPAVARIWKDLGIMAGSVLSAPQGAGILIGLPSGGGAYAATDVTKAVLAEAQKADNRRKLAASGLEERHLFVLIHDRNYLPWVALVDLQPDDAPVVLPTEITHVWAAGRGRGVDDRVIWRASSGKRWVMVNPQAED